MANNDKKTEKLNETKSQIEELIAKRTAKFKERDSLTGNREARRKINNEIKSLNQELSDFGREFTTKIDELTKEISKLKKVKGKKDRIRYEINGKEQFDHISTNVKGKFYNITSDLDMYYQLQNYYNETVTIDERGIVSEYKIDEEAVSSMSEEEKLEYFDKLCGSISDPKKVFNPARSVSTGSHYCIVNEIDEEIFLESLERYKKALLEVEKKRNDPIRMKAVQELINQQIIVTDIELSNFKIDWDYVNSLDDYEKRAEYFNNLAKEIAAAPKGQKIERIPLGKSTVTVNAADKFIFSQCFTEYKKAKKEHERRTTPSYNIDWDYVNTLKSAEERANYFEDLCGKISATEIIDPVTIPFKNHEFVVSKKDAIVFSTSMKEFEKNYLQALNEQKEAEKARIEEEKRQREAEEERIKEEKRKQEEDARLAEEKRIEEAKKIAAIAAEAKRIEAEEKAEALRKEQEQLAIIEQNIKEGTSNEQKEETIEIPKSKVEIPEKLKTPDEDEDYQFLSLMAQQHQGGQPRKEEITVVPNAEDILNSITNEDSTGTPSENAIDFFDDDEEDNYILDEEDKEKQADDKQEENIKDDVEDKDPTEDVLDKEPEEGEEEIININGIEIIDLNEPTKNEKDEDKDKDDDKKDDNDQDKGQNGGKRSLKDRIREKFGKHKKDTNNSETYEVPNSEEAIEIVENEDVAQNLKVLSSKAFTGDISNSKLYTIRKNFYLTVMDWMTEQKITNKVQVVTKRQSAEVDEKYADIYKFFANQYEKLEDTYERIAADKYYNLKRNFAIGGSVAVATIAAIAFVSFNKGATRGNVEYNDFINAEYETESQDGPLENIKLDNLTINTIEDTLRVVEEQVIEESHEDSISSPIYELKKENGSVDPYTYSGTTVPEAFNINPSDLSTDDVTEEIIQEAEHNGTSLLQYVR